jgi:hypothetical protein
MANELLTSGTFGGNTLVAEVHSRLVILALADRYSLRNHMALVRLGEDLIGSTTEHISIYSLDGVDSMSSPTEITAVANTTITTAEATVAPARRGLAYEYSDHRQAVDADGVVSSDRLAMSIVSSAAMTLTDLIAQEGDGFTQVGTTGVSFTHDTFLSAQFALKQASVPGPYLTVLKAKQFTDWQNDLESRGGVTQWRAATEEMQMLRGPGFEGAYNGIEVVTSSKVQSINAAADWAGFMFGRGALAYKELRMANPPRSQIVILDVGGVIRIAESRTEDSAKTKVTGHYYVGTVTLETGRGRTLISAQ